MGALLVRSSASGPSWLRTVFFLDRQQQAQVQQLQRIYVWHGISYHSVQTFHCRKCSMYCMLNKMNCRLTDGSSIDDESTAIDPDIRELLLQDDCAIVACRLDISCEFQKG